MMISPKVITAPTTEPVSITEAKLQARVDGTAEDSLFSIYIEAAREYYEWRTGRTVHETTYEYVLDDWPSSTGASQQRFVDPRRGIVYWQDPGNAIILPRATPLVSITHVKYKDSTGAETTWSSSEYIADTDNEPGRLVLGYDQSWPSFTAYPVNPIRIRYKAGIATTSPITEASSADKIPILLLVAALYDNRNAILIPDRNGVEQIAIQYGVEAFISKRVVEYVF